MTEQIHITGISHDGDGIGRAEDGSVVRIPGTLPGETVQATIGAGSKGMREGRCTTMVQASENRRTPPCEKAGRCGGCALQHAEPSLQAELKQRIVQDAMTRIGKLDVHVLPTVTMVHPWGYRNKGIFHVDYRHGAARLGFFEKGSHDLVPAAECLLFSKQVQQLVTWLEEAITATGLAYHITKVMIRESHLDGTLMVVFVTEDSTFKAPEIVNKLRDEWPKVRSVWHNINTNPRLILGKAFQKLAGEDTISDRIGTRTYKLSPQSFFQVNTAQTQVLYDLVRDHAKLQGHETVLDLYCGIGTIGMHLADQAAQIIGVESNHQAIRDAKASAKDNGVKNATFYAAKAEEWLPKWMQQNNSPDLVVLDPPRKGCDKRLIETLIANDIQRIVYVSCNPATLARDLRLFRDAGYSIGDVQPVDMFPQTGHVETVVLLSHKKSQASSPSL